MRFFEYESRKLVEQAGIPVTKYGFATTADEAATIAADIGGPTVIKSQVLTGGRMKAGGVQFADTPDEAAGARRGHPEARDQRPHAPRRAGRPQGRGQAGVLRGRGLGRHRQAAADAVLATWAASTSSRWPRSTPTTSGAATSRTSSPFSDYQAKQVIAAAGVTGKPLQRLTPILARLAQLFRDRDMTLAEINPLAELEDGSFVALDAHMEMEEEAKPRQKKVLAGARHRGGRQPRGLRAVRVRGRGRRDRRRRPPRRDPGQGHRLPRQHRPGDRRRRRLAHAHRRGPLAGRQARQLLPRSAATRRSPRPAAWPSRCSRRTAWRRSR